MPEEKTIAYSIREFFRELFRSSYVRHLEQEVVRQRMDYDSRIRQLLAEKIELVRKIDKLEIALIPQLRKPVSEALRVSPNFNSSTVEMAPSSWSQALEEHNRQLEKEDMANATQAGGK